MGVVGFGPDQELNVLEKYGFGLKPDMVVEAICSLNDSGDIYKDGIYTLTDGVLEVAKNNPVKSMVFSSFSSIINQINFIKNKDYILGSLDPLLFDDTYDLTWMKYRDSEESNYKFALMKDILGKMGDEIKSKNIDFLAIIIPSYNNMCDDSSFKENKVDPNSYFTNENVYQQIFETEKIPYINLVPLFLKLDKPIRCSLYDAGNAHLSPLGNWYAAQIISNYMESRGQAKN